MRHRIFAATLVTALSMGACSKQQAPDAADSQAAVATVNGEPISRSQFDFYLDSIAQQSGREVSDEQRDQVLDQLISLHLAADAAEKSGLAEDARIRDELEITRVNVLADAVLQKFIKEHPVEDSELKPEYDAQVSAMPREYHARHILVDDKAEADAIVRQLQSGADFAKLAAQKSKDTTSAKDGGDLRWFTLGSMVKPFSDAVAKLQPGQLTEEPVQSQYGWHVIKLEETRASSAPPFDDVKEQVRMMVQRKRLQSYLDSLREGAKIEKHLNSAPAGEPPAGDEPAS